MADSLAAPVANSEGDAALPDDLVSTIKAKAKLARNARANWIKEARECYGFVAGDQWTPTELETLKDQRRPPVVFNRIEPVINVVAGLEVTNRQEVRYLPRELGDAGANEVYTGAAEWVRDECNAEDEESEAFVDMATCGEGWTETRLDYEYDHDGTILTARVDPLEMLPDPDATKKNYKGAEFLIRERMVSLSWIKETWPDKAQELDITLETSSGSREFDGESHHNVQGDQYQAPDHKTGERNTQKTVKLTEYQYKKREPFYRVQDPGTQQIAELSVEEHDKAQAAARATLGTKLKSVRQTKCVHYRAFLVGNTLLEDAECPDPNSFTYFAMTAKRDRNKSCWYGLVRPMLDPQRWANKFFSQSMFILSTNAKGGVMVEKDAVEDPNAFEQSWADPQKVTYLKSGAIAAGKIQAKVPPPFPPELAQLLEFSIASIYQVSGVSPEMLGTVDREQAAILEYQRKQAGVTILATLFDALRKYRKEQGKCMLYLIDNYISDGRLVRIVGEEGAKYVPLTKQEGVLKYDVIIDESPSSPNQKERTWAILQGLLPMLIKAGAPIPPEVMEYLPLPQSLLDKMKKPDPQKVAEQQQAKQLEIAGKQAEVAKTAADAEKSKAEADVKREELKGKQVENADLFTKVMADLQAASQPQQAPQQGPSPEIQAFMQAIGTVVQGMAANMQQTQQMIAQNAQQTQALIGVMSAPNVVERDPVTGAVIGTRKAMVQ